MPRESEKALTWLASRLDSELHPGAPVVADAIAYEPLRSHALVVLAPHLSAGLLTEAMAMAGTFRFADDRAHTMIELVPYLPAGRQTAAVVKALTDLRALAFPSDRAAGLARLAPYLTVEQFNDELAAFSVRDTVRSSGVEGVNSLLNAAAQLDAGSYVSILRAAFGSAGRAACFTLLDECLPSLAALTGPEMAVRLKATIQDVHRWWP